MNVLAWILTGLVVGAVAKLIMPGRDPGGCIVTILLGIAGALLAAYVAQAMGWHHGAGWRGWLASIGGAVVLLLLYRLFIGRSAR